MAHLTGTLERPTAAITAGDRLELIDHALELLRIGHRGELRKAAAGADAVGFYVKWERELEDRRRALIARAVAKHDVVTLAKVSGVERAELGDRVARTHIQEIQTGRPARLDLSK